MTTCNQSQNNSGNSRNSPPLETAKSDQMEKSHLLYFSWSIWFHVYFVLQENCTGLHLFSTRGFLSSSVLLLSSGCVCVTWLRSVDTHFVARHSSRPEHLLHSGTKMPDSHSTDYLLFMTIASIVLNELDCFLFSGKGSAEGCYGKCSSASLLAHPWQWVSGMLCRNLERGGRWGLWLKDSVASSGLFMDIQYSDKRALSISSDIRLVQRSLTNSL